MVLRNLHYILRVENSLLLLPITKICSPSIKITKTTTDNLLLIMENMLAVGSKSAELLMESGPTRLTSSRLTLETKDSTLLKAKWRKEHLSSNGIFMEEITNPGSSRLFNILAINGTAIIIITTNTSIIMVTATATVTVIVPNSSNSSSSLYWDLSIGVNNLLAVLLLSVSVDSLVFPHSRPIKTMCSMQSMATV